MYPQQVEAFGNGMLTLSPYRTSGKKMNIRNLQMLANAQQSQSAVPRAPYAHIAEPNRPFRAAIWPVSATKTACFRMQNEAFCNSLKDNRLARMVITGDFDMKV